MKGPSLETERGLFLVWYGRIIMWKKIFGGSKHNDIQEENPLYDKIDPKRLPRHDKIRGGHRRAAG